MKFVAVAINGILDLKNFYPLSIELRTKHGIWVDVIGHKPGLEAIERSYDGLIVGSDWNQNAPIVDAFNKSGKPTILVQSEGMFIDEALWYVGTTPRCLLSCVWGPEHEAIFRKRGYKGKIIVSGPPRFDTYYNFRPVMTKGDVYKTLGLADLSKPYILYVGQFFHIAEFGEALYNQQVELTKFAAQTGASFYGIIKSHPQETPANFFSRESVIEQQGQDHIKIIDQSGHSEAVEISTLIYYSKCVVTFSSTAAIEAIHLDIPAAIYCSILQSPLSDGRLASLPSISTQEELARVISSISKKDALTEFTSRFLPGSITGKFTSSTAQAIKDFTKQMSSKHC